MSGREGDLERRLAALLVENRRLRNLLKVTHGVEPPPEQPAFATEDPGLVTNASPLQAKLDLYLNRFAARTDVYAYYWENPRKKTKGWSPKVRDPFGRGTMWDKRPLPLTRDVIEAHLRADDDLFVGLYPLLRDATCWWLAVDFDGPQAMLDAHAYIKAAHSLGVPCGLEVSQSGRGAHVWTFFTAPVPAATARAMGTACVHRAIGLRGSMPLASFDRLFPNQDTVPAGASGSPSFRRPVAEIRELTAGYGQVIVDECHHVAAATYDHTLGQIPATWWLGLTATPERRDGLEELTTWQLGLIRHAVRDARPEPGMLPMTDHGLPRLLRVHETGFRAPEGFDLAEPGAISALYGTLAADVDRNRQIADDVREALDSGRRCLVLSRRRDHLDVLAGLLSDRDPTILRGGTSRKDMDRFRERIADVEPGVPLLVLATLPFAGEGFDAPILDAVFLVAPISFPGILVQAVGRVLRRHQDKTDIVVHDYIDAAVTVLAAQYVRRRQAYDHLGFHRG